MARLPGGLTAWRGRRLLGNIQEPRRSGLPLVGASRHAALHSLVLDAVKHADVAFPAAVRLGGAPTARLTAGELVIGLPLVAGLPADQLRAVLAHELALPPSRHPDLVRGLLNARLREPEPGTAANRQARLLTATEGLLGEAERVRDAAAVNAVGGGLGAVEDAALALLRAAAIEAVFTAFAAAEGTPEVDGLPRRVADLHAGWRLRLAEWGAPAHDLTEVLATLPDRHPGLAAELRSTAGSDRPVALAADTVALDELSAEDEQALAADVLTGDLPWTRFADLPVAVYLAEVERRAREYVEAVQAVLGRAPDGRDELAGTLLRRPVDVERARRGLPPATEDDDRSAPPWMGATLLAVVVEYTLLRRGWRRAHPLLPRRLTGPDGAALDLNELVRRPEELSRYLRD
ncbi:hypothetical protein KZZ52_56040 [Dactylosporangium sp. AC04546]|uniref:hypothetical protein n=1 Tax=Dactylosporangium sp. AC04546 TaxID=2862460 RepID=UPI001EDE05E4|nr:hypothetical protein [Dactylosporangium sp. AC04546]WVK83134.1 hypothetical protein KZZ52_56040 [Dactylosporangium sp. AC04546]